MTSRLRMCGLMAMTVGAVSPWVPTVVVAQDGGTTVWDGVYTSDQAVRGEAVYAGHCGACHLADLSGTPEASALVGDGFMQDWREDTMNTLFTRVRTLMPFDEPGSLTDGDYLDSIAFILQANGFPAGSRELTTDGLADIRIEAEDGPGEVPSFALVRVVGCLSRGPDDGWRLTRATAAVRTADPAASPAEALAALAPAPLGQQTIGLMAVYPDPAPHAGHTMEAKGFLIRDADGDRINVSTLGMVAPTCGP